MSAAEATPAPAPERESFKVDLRGMVDVLSHHLYSSQTVYLREVLQNARDALAARTQIDPGFTGGAIEVTPARGGAPLEIRDNGVGLTAAEMRDLLATIGGSSKRHELEVTRAKFLGQFGIGLFSSFLVADTVEVVSRSARADDAATIRWIGHADGTYTVQEHAEPLDSPGSVVRLQPRHGELEICAEESVHRLASTFAELLDVPVRVDGELVSQRPAPWELDVEDQLAWCRERMGFEAMGIIPLESAMLDVKGLAFVLPHTAEPGHRAGDRIYSRGMLVSASEDHLLPSWAFFCRAVVDAGRLPLTASREALQQTTSLDHVRERLGAGLLSELIMVQGLHPDVYQDIVRLHSAGLKSLAVSSDDMRGLLRSTLPLRTTIGDRTLDELQRRGGRIDYVTDAPTYAALKDVAAHADALVVDASGVSDPSLLRTLAQESDGLQIREIGAEHVLELAELRAPVDEQRADTLAQVARESLGPGVEVRIARFAPAERPVIWAPGPGAASRGGSAAAQGGADADAADAPAADAGAHEVLVLNADNDAIARLLEQPNRRTPALVRAHLVLGRLLAGVQPAAAADPEMLRDALHVLAGYSG